MSEDRYSLDGKVHDAQRLKELQALPLDRKIQITVARIIEFVEAMGGVDNVYISYSGGKDSTVLLDITRKIYPTIKCVYSDTGLEYPEIRQMARDAGADIIRPEMRFDEVITKYGYPLVSKEVSEAIYYARRIRNSPNSKHKNDKTHPEKEMKLMANVTENIPNGLNSNENLLNVDVGGIKKQKDEEMICSDSDNTKDWDRSWAFDGGGKWSQMQDETPWSHQSLQGTKTGREEDLNCSDVCQSTSKTTTILQSRHSKMYETLRQRCKLLGKENEFGNKEHGYTQRIILLECEMD